MSVQDTTRPSLESEDQTKEPEIIVPLDLPGLQRLSSKEATGVIECHNLRHTGLIHPIYVVSMVQKTNS
jgi:hypothetical protein